MKFSKERPKTNYLYSNTRILTKKALMSDKNLYLSTM